MLPPLEILHLYWGWWMPLCHGEGYVGRGCTQMFYLPCFSTWKRCRCWRTPWYVDHCSVTNSKSIAHLFFLMQSCFLQLELMSKWQWATQSLSSVLFSRGKAGLCLKEILLFPLHSASSSLVVRNPSRQRHFFHESRKRRLWMACHRLSWVVIQFPVHLSLKLPSFPLGSNIQVSQQSSNMNMVPSDLLISLWLSWIPVRRWVNGVIVELGIELSHLTGSRKIDPNSENMYLWDNLCSICWCSVLSLPFPLIAPADYFGPPTFQRKEVLITSLLPHYFQVSFLSQ